MGQRHILVIGSQCPKLGKLSFLPDVAVRFHAVMTNPGPGECVGAAVGDPPGLLLDPTVAQPKWAVKSAYHLAANAGATLILAYIGHGEFVRGDFFLMPTDAACPPTSDEAILFAQFIKELTNQP